MKDFFITGPISPMFFAETIANFQLNTSIGAQSTFLGQVREDKIDSKKVKAIEYSAYIPVVESEFLKLQNEIFVKYKIVDFCVKHSLGKVRAGQICLLIIVVGEHRKSAIPAMNYILEYIKSNFPIFGKEIFEDQSHQWKVNT